jgi:hypothetical protein
MIKIWREHAGRRFVWRGHITHVPDGARQQLRSPPLPSTWSYRPSSDDETDLSIMIETETTSATLPLCRVLVTVDDPSDPIPERESEVTLQYNHVTLTTTTHHGTVAFPNIPVDAVTQMRITVVKSPA